MGYQQGASNIWFNMPGVVGAYQPISAPSQVASYQNVGKGRLGSYTAAVGVAPTWAGPTGWGFNGTQYLNTSMSSAIKPFSALVRANIASIVTYPTFWGGNSDSGCIQFYVKAVTGKTALSKAGIVDIGVSTGAATLGVDQVLAVTYGATGAYVFYRNGTADGSGTENQTFTDRTSQIGGHQAGNLMNGYMAAIVVYPRILTPAEMWLASLQMAHCEANPDWNAWAPRRQYWIAPSAAAGRVGIYGVRATIALPGGVQIRPGTGGIM